MPRAAPCARRRALGGGNAGDDGAGDDHVAGGLGRRRLRADGATVRREREDDARLLVLSVVTGRCGAAVPAACRAIASHGPHVGLASLRALALLAL